MLDCPGHQQLFPPVAELRAWHVDPATVAQHHFPILATVIPYKSYPIAPTLPASSHDHISSSSLQRASPLFWSPIPAFGDPLLQPAPLRCKAPPQSSSSPLPALSLVLASHGVGFSVRLGVNWYIPNTRRRHPIPFPTLSDVLVYLTTRFIDSAATNLVAHNQISSFWERLFHWQPASTRQRSFGATHS